MKTKKLIFKIKILECPDGHGGIAAECPCCHKSILSLKVNSKCGNLEGSTHTDSILSFWKYCNCGKKRVLNDAKITESYEALESGDVLDFVNPQSGERIAKLKVK